MKSILSKQYWLLGGTLSLLCAIPNDIHALVKIKPNSTQEVLELIKDYLPSKSVIVEAGSYNGNDTFQISHSWPLGTVYAFEPVPEFFTLLKKKMQALPNVHCFNLALGENSGTAEFHPAFNPKNPKQGYPSGSLLEPKEHLNFSSVIFNGVIHVKKVTLDEWMQQQHVNHVDFIWLDLQGYELNVLKASPTCMKTLKAVYTEVEFVEAYKNQYLYNDVKQFLQEHGFMLIATDFDECDAYKPSIKQGERWYGNALFVRLEK